MTPASEQARRLLDERARALAQPLTPDEEPAQMLDLVVFALGATRYGVDARHVVEALALEDLTRVPGTSALLLGVVNHRGRVLPVYDLGRLLSPAGDTGASRAWLIAVTHDDITLGIGADAIEATAAHFVGALAAAPGGDRAGLVRGVTESLLTVLDVEALTLDRRLYIDDSELP